jgi:hypothetical protein
VKTTILSYHQQAQPRQFESLRIEATVELEGGDSLEAAAAALGARVRRILAAQLELARAPESTWLAGDDDPGAPAH